MSIEIKKYYYLYISSLILYLAIPLLISYFLGYFWGLIGFAIVLLFFPLKIFINLILAVYITFYKKRFYYKKILPLSNYILIFLIILDCVWFLGVLGVEEVSSITLLSAFSFVVAYLPFYCVFIFNKFINKKAQNK